MGTTARLGLDIVAIDKSRAAFASVNRQLTGLTSNVNSTLRTVKQFRGAFAAAFVGLGIRAAIDGLGRAVDKNLVQGADRMQSRWATAWDGFRDRGDKYIAEAAMELTGLVDTANQFLGLMDQVGQQSVNRAGQGNRFTPAPGATYGKGLPNNLTDIGKTAQAVQAVNTALKENAIGYKEAEKAKREWAFGKDILQGLNDEVSILKIRVEMYGQSDTAIEAAVTQQQALNEAIAAGHPLSEDELALLDQKIDALRDLGAQMEDLRRQEDGLKKQQEAIQETAAPFKSFFTGVSQDIAKGTSAAKAFKDELGQLGQRLLALATDTAFELLLNFMLPGSGFATSGIAGYLASSFGGGFAKGGNLGAGKWGVAGENGPELISGPAGITPMSGGGAGGRGGGAPEIHIHNNAPGIEVTQQASGWGDKRRVDFYIEAKAQQAARPKQMKRR